MNGSSIYLEILQNRTEPILYEDVDWFVLFAKRPCNEGHLLVIPKLKTAEFYDLPTTTLERGFEIATRLCKALRNIYSPPRVALFIKGFTNDDHAHIHIAPVFASSDLDKDFTRPELTVSEMESLAVKLQPVVNDTLQKVPSLI